MANINERWDYNSGWVVVHPTRSNYFYQLHWVVSAGVEDSNYKERSWIPSSLFVSLCHYSLICISLLGNYNKILRSGWLRQQTFISHSSGVWEVPDKVWQSRFHSKSSSWLIGATLLLWAYMAERERDWTLWCLFWRRKSHHQLPPLLNYLPKAPYPSIITLEIRATT